MAKKKSNRGEPLPIRKSSHIMEDDSNDIFREVIKPWIFRGSVTREYGIDGTVEITKARSTLSDQIVTGKRFSVQIKSSTTTDFNSARFSLSVPKEKINYWLNSIEPVLIVYIDLSSNSCYFHWVDEKLVQGLFQSNPNWIAQETVSIVFERGKKITAQSVLEIEKYVLTWKQSSKTILTPGNYFKFSQEAKSLIDSLLSIVTKHKIKFLPNELKALKESVSQTIYTIAVVGPTKAGKSTLINCLLRREVSPVGMLPTTGIPITIIPSNENKSVVLFKDNTEVLGGVDEKFLKEYTSKSKNPENKKDVKLVTVHIINTLLEKGFAICDVPGLDDPDKEIVNITKTALFNVNAIIYLVSTGPMISGDFSLDRHVIEDIASLSSKMDRLFLVFNKIDILDDQMLDEVKAYVNETLKRFDVLDYLPTVPLYISSKKSFESRIQGLTYDSVSELEAQLWEYLLSQNKTGLNKIIGTFGDSLELIERLKNVSNARLINLEKRTELERDIALVSNEIDQLRQLVGTKRQQIYSNLQEYLKTSFSNLISYMKTELEKTSPDLNLPENHQISKWLENNAHQTISDVYSNLQQQIYELQSEINQWVLNKLKQVEIGLDDPENEYSFRMPDIARYTSQINTIFYQQKAGAIGFVESIFEGLGTLIGDLIAYIENLFTAKEKKRENQIKDIISKSTRSYNNIAKDLQINMGKYLSKICRFMEEKSIDRARVYLGTLSDQLEKLDKPLTTDEKRNFVNFLSESSVLENKINSNLLHLQDYVDGIKWLKQDSHSS